MSISHSCSFLRSTSSCKELMLYLSICILVKSVILVSSCHHFLIAVFVPNRYICLFEYLFSVLLDTHLKIELLCWFKFNCMRNYYNFFFSNYCVISLSCHRYLQVSIAAHLCSTRCPWVVPYTWNCQQSSLSTDKCKRKTQIIRNLKINRKSVRIPDN